MTTILGWWFGPYDDKLRSGDGRLAQVGVTHRIIGELVRYQNALHMSERVVDGLLNTDALILWRVEGAEEIIKIGAGIVACRSRTYLARADATETILAWARRCARDVMDLWYVPETVRRFLITGEAPQAAASSAYSAVCSAEHSAERSALNTAWEPNATVATARAESSVYAAESAEYAALAAYSATPGYAARAALLAAASDSETDAETHNKYAAWLEEDCTALMDQRG